MNYKIDIQSFPCVKKFHSFFRNLLIFTVILITIVLTVLIVNRGIPMLDWLYDIIIGAISGCITSFITIIISYYKFLKKIPEATESKINQLLNDRLSYETSNHNSVLETLSSDSRALSTEHHNMHLDITEIKGNVADIKNQKNADYRLLDGAEKRICQNIDSLHDFSNLFADLHRKNALLEDDVQRLTYQLKTEQLKNEHLQATVETLQRGTPSSRSKKRALDLGEEMEF